MKGFPVTVDYINRFKSTKDQKETIKKLEEGKIDILIGTHRLLGKDVKFKDLGLLIVDEEQKFGVGAKDKLKTLKANVDTLTLTATPIPRTLQFSMMGARDLSVINTPPPNRYPVQTQVSQFNEKTIKEGIEYELNRSGQVFFVHNRVQNIGRYAELIQKLCPKARVLVAHGQLSGETLEKAMLDFIEGEYDVLICTTIIESGLDISNANTIIINDAQNYGLSDLYQLRGRVGRSNKKAFCYLLTPPFASLTNEAKKRLRAIEEFSDLGSGFNIAMRDLDIRGAGNLLGAEQSGFITEIGYEMYQKILDEAIAELKEEMDDGKGKMDDGKLHQPSTINHQPFVRDCAIDTDLEVLIPEEYVESITERIALYQQLDNSKTEDDLISFEKQLKDRFGEIPEETKKLISIVRLRWLAVELGFEKLVLKNGKLTAWFVSNQKSLYYQSNTFLKIIQFVQSNPKTCTINEGENNLTLKIDHIKDIDGAMEMLKKMKGQL
jgi:transcription-repair coupling factor (superfamily II helicase)